MRDSTIDPEQLRDQLLAEIAERVPIVDFSGPGFIEVAVLLPDVQKVTEYLYDLARVRHLKVELRAQRKRLHLEGALLLEIDSFVAETRAFTAHVCTGATHETLTVGFEVWEELDDHLQGRVANPLLRRLSTRAAQELGLFRVGAPVHGRDLHEHPLVLEPDFPIDVVYTWVNHLDPEWRKLRSSVTGTKLERERTDGKSLDRFKNHDELKYSLRSAMQFAPWVRTIFVVTNCAPPAWLDVDNPKLEWIDHADIIPENCLPTFNSHAIEARLHHVPGLSEHFLYLNDDFFLTRRTTAGDFFFCNGMSKSFMDPSATAIGATHPDDPDYLNAARNGRRLLEAAFQRTAPSIHNHAPYALRRDVLLEMEQRFGEPIAATTRRQFRSEQDISTVSYLYHHYAYVTGRALYWPSDALVLTYKTHEYAGALTSLLESDRRPLSVCLNDGFGSTSLPRWKRHVTDFLEAFYPNASELERAS